MPQGLQQRCILPGGVVRGDFPGSLQVLGQRTKRLPGEPQGRIRIAAPPKNHEGKQPAIGQRRQKNQRKPGRGTEPSSRAISLPFKRVEVLIVGGDASLERFEFRLHASADGESFRVAGGHNLGARD